jgi:hypothetical protein
VQVATEEGVVGAYTNTVAVEWELPEVRVYLPLILRNE